MTSKCGESKKVVHEAQPSVSLMFLPHFVIVIGSHFVIVIGSHFVIVIGSKNHATVKLELSAVITYASVLQQSENQSECVDN